jgi:hypothetical protein
MQPAPFLQHLLLGLTMRRVGHAGARRAYLSTMRRLVGSHALGAPVGIDGVRSADGFIGASWPTVSTQPGNCSAFFSDDFVGYRLSFLSGLVLTIVPFPILYVNYTPMRTLPIGECRGAKPLCQGFGGAPQFLKSPKTGGYRGLILEIRILPETKRPSHRISQREGLFYRKE